MSIAARRRMRSRGQGLVLEAEARREHDAAAQADAAIASLSGERGGRAGASTGPTHVHERLNRGRTATGRQRSGSRRLPFRTKVDSFSPLTASRPVRKEYFIPWSGDKENTPFQRPLQRDMDLIDRKILDPLQQRRDSLDRRDRRPRRPVADTVLEAHPAARAQGVDRAAGRAAQSGEARPRPDGVRLRSRRTTTRRPGSRALRSS